MKGNAFVDALKERAVAAAVAAAAATSAASAAADHHDDDFCDADEAVAAFGVEFAGPGDADSDAGSVSWRLSREDCSDLAEEQCASSSSLAGDGGYHGDSDSAGDGDVGGDGDGNSLNLVDCSSDNAIADELIVHEQQQQFFDSASLVRTTDFIVHEMQQQQRPWFDDIQSRVDVIRKQLETGAGGAKLHPVSPAKQQQHQQKQQQQHAPTKASLRQAVSAKSI